MAVKTTYYKSFDGFYFELTEFSSRVSCSIYDKDGKFKECVEGKDRNEVSDTILSCMTYDAYFLDEEIIHGINSYSDFKRYMETGKLPEVKPVEVPKAVKETKSIIRTEEDAKAAFAEIDRLADEEAKRIKEQIQTKKADVKQDALSSEEAARLVAEEVAQITGEPIDVPVEKKSEIEVEDEDDNKISTEDYAMPDLTDFSIF